MKHRLLATLTVLAMVWSGAMSAAAQSTGQDSATDQTQDDKSAGVARISLIHGEVSTQRGDSGDWSAAALNAPIVSGDKVSTGDDGRAEIQLDYANLVRIGSHSQATIASLSRNQIQVQIGQGIANYDVFKNGDANAEIDTPNVALHPGRNDGSFRIEVRPDGDTEITVRKGDAEVSTPQGSTHIERGQMITVRGAGNDTQYKIAEAPARDDWDRWNNDRDNIIHNAQSWRHTNRYYTGSEDLDAYGHWETVPDYGPVWAPAVDPDWVPYRAGHWVWEPYWGWTWVSYEPWGWAPYHYGRWFFYGSSWVWWPGPVGGFGWGYPYRPIWAPAYVSFFGFGGGVGFGVGFGSFGWLPIGPCDRFYPWWGGYRNRFDVVHVTNIYNFHGDREFGGFRPLHDGDRFSNLRLAAANQHIQRAVSTVPANGFGSGRAAARGVDPAMFRQGRMMTGNLPVTPTRESLSASNRPASQGTIRGGQAQHFFGRPASAPQPFEHQATQVQQALQRNGGGLSSNSQLRTNTTAEPGRGSATSGTVRTGADVKGTLARPSPATSMPNAQNRGPANSPNSGRTGSSGNEGWRSFGSSPAGNRPAAGSLPQNNGSNQGVWRSGSGSTPEGSRPTNNVPRPPNATSSGSNGTFRSINTPRSENPSNSAPRPNNSSPDRSGGWQPFTPHSGIEPSPSRPSGSSSNLRPGNYSGYSGYGGSSVNSARPPLNMRQPVVSPRSYGGWSGGGSSGGNAPSRAYGGGRYPSGGGYSGGSAAPSSGYGGGRNPSGGGYSGGYAPGGGGGYHGGGSGGGGPHGGGGGGGGGGHSNGGGGPHGGGSRR
jgi:hypothetical protein